MGGDSPSPPHSPLIVNSETFDMSDIGQLDGKSEEIAECKRHFSHFYGEQGIEHGLAHMLLNVILIIERSLYMQGENKNKVINQWVQSSPLRTQLTENIRKIVSSC